MQRLGIPEDVSLYRSWWDTCGFSTLVCWSPSLQMLDRVICGCLSAATSANYPLQHPHIRILPPAILSHTIMYILNQLCEQSTNFHNCASVTWMMVNKWWRWRSWWWHCVF